MRSVTSNGSSPGESPAASRNRRFRESSGIVVLVFNFLRWLRARAYRWRPHLGLTEALIWSSSLDVWLRYTALREVLGRDLSPGDSILEIGPGWFGLEFFLGRGSENSGRLVQADILLWPVTNRVSGEERLMASGSFLPFRDASFDHVVAMDVLEHIPKEHRLTFCREVQRVTRRTAVLHMPLDSPEHGYQAERYDLLFQEIYRKKFGTWERNIEEHIRFGHPTPEEVKEYFPNCLLLGTQRARDWLWYTYRGRLPLGMLFTGIVMYLRGISKGPPFYSGLLVWSPQDVEGSEEGSKLHRLRLTGGS